MEDRPEQTVTNPFGILFPIFIALCFLNIFLNIFGLPLVKFVFLSQTIILAIILFTSDQKAGLWALTIYILFEGQGRIVWGYNIFFRLNFDFLLGILILRAIISNKKLINREVVPNYLIIGVFLHLVWFVMELFNPNGAGVFPAFATSKIYVFPILLFFFLQNFPLDFNSFKNQQLIFLFTVFLLLGAVVVIIQNQAGQEFLYGISQHYVNLFSKFQNFTGNQFRPWGMSYAPGGMSVLFWQASPFFLLLRPDIIAKASKPKKTLLNLYKLLGLPLLFYASFICQVRSSTLKLLLITAGFLCLRFLVSKFKFKNSVAVIGAFLVMSVFVGTNSNLFDLEKLGLSGALSRYDGLDSSALLTQRAGFDEFVEEVERKIDFPFGYGPGMTQNFLPNFEAKRARYVDKPTGFFWSHDNLILFLLLELGLGAFFYLFIIFAVNLSLASRTITLLRLKEFNNFSIVACCSVTIIVLTVFNWGAVGIPFNPESFFFWFWAALGFNAFRNVKVNKNIVE